MIEEHSKKDLYVKKSLSESDTLLAMSFMIFCQELIQCRSH